MMFSTSRTQKGDYMTDAFVVFVRFEEKLLLLKRGASDGDFPGLWDGVWGVADSQEEVLQRVWLMRKFN